MFEEVRIRERKSVKYGKTYEYRFETAPVGGERKWLSKGGFLTEEEAKEAGIEAWKRYCLCGLSERPSDISYADFLDEWMEKECKYNLKETTLLNYRKRIYNHYLIHNLYAVVFLVLLLLISMKLRLDNGLLQFLGENTFGIYILQRIPMILLTHYGIMKYSAVNMYIACFLITCILSLIFTGCLKMIDARLFRGSRK